jgi:hypothetical protein
MTSRMFWISFEKKTDEHGVEFDSASTLKPSSGWLL